MLITNRRKKKIPHAPPQRHTHSADRCSPSYLTCSPAYLARSPAYLDRRVRSRSVRRRALLARVPRSLPGVPPDSPVYITCSPVYLDRRASSRSAQRRPLLAGVPHSIVRCSPSYLAAVLLVRVPRPTRSGTSPWPSPRVTLC